MYLFEIPFNLQNVTLLQGMTQNGLINNHEDRGSPEDVQNTRMKLEIELDYDKIREQCKLTDTDDIILQKFKNMFVN